MTLLTIAFTISFLIILYALLTAKPEPAWHCTDRVPTGNVDIISHMAAGDTALPVQAAA